MIRHIILSISNYTNIDCGTTFLGCWRRWFYVTTWLLTIRTCVYTFVFACYFHFASKANAVLIFHHDWTRLKSFDLSLWKYIISNSYWLNYTFTHKFMKVSYFVNLHTTHLIWAHMAFWPHRLRSAFDGLIERLESGGRWFIGPWKLPKGEMVDGTYANPTWMIAWNKFVLRAGSL